LEQVHLRSDVASFGPESQNKDLLFGEGSSLVEVFDVVVEVLEVLLDLLQDPHEWRTGVDLWALLAAPEERLVQALELALEVASLLFLRHVQPQSFNKRLGLLDGVPRIDGELC